MMTGTLCITTGFIIPVFCAEAHYSSTSLTLNTKMLLTLAVLTLVPRLTGGRHTPDLVQILLRPQLLEAQALAEALSPSCRHRGGEAAVTSARLAGCEVSWALARPGGGGGVVFLVAGRDGAGMWNLLATNLTSTSLQLDRRLAAKLQQAAVFAVSGRGVEASITVEAEAAGECREAVPAPGQWTEATEAGLPSPSTSSSTSTSTSSLAIVTLAVVSVLLTSVTAAVLLLRLRRAGHGKAGDEEAVPELPYSAPFSMVTPHQDTQLQTSPEQLCPPSFPTLASEASLQPRIISTIYESDEYEEVDLTHTTE